MSWKMYTQALCNVGFLHILLSKTLCNRASSSEQFGLKKVFQFETAHYLVPLNNDLVTRLLTVCSSLHPCQTLGETTRLGGSCTVWFLLGKNCTETIAWALTSSATLDKLHRFLNI